MGLDGLPPEVLLRICGNLDTWNLLGLREVCKSFCEVANSRIWCEVTVLMETERFQLGFDDCICSDFHLDYLRGSVLEDGLQFWLDRLKKLTFVGHSSSAPIHMSAFAGALFAILCHIEETPTMRYRPFVLDLSSVNLSSMPLRKSIIRRINSSEANFKTTVLIKTDKRPVKEANEPCAVLGPKFAKVTFASDDEGAPFTPQEWFRFDDTSDIDYMCFSFIAANLSTVERMLQGCPRIPHIRILYCELKFDKELGLAEIAFRKAEVVEVLDTLITIEGNRDSNEPFQARDLKIEDLKLLELFNYNFPNLEILTLRDRAYFDSPQSIYSTEEIVPLLTNLKVLHTWLQDWSTCHLFKSPEFARCPLKEIHLLLLNFDLETMLSPFKNPPHLEYLSIESKSSFHITWDQTQQYAKDLFSAGKSLLQVQFSDPFRAITFQKNGKIVLNGMPLEIQAP
ncbi:hypothetical protein TRICI_001250 [Trichomonascus ciferrii]|uniref:F-box domain-containing protein n=1 Tax=Trichomonascus ciferrii TaxID=44093 RepID=A0A642VCQ7_9ASCO|nr:hypothetical protein TRICI_001250 [Trichomonascus ciferrii]